MLTGSFNRRICFLLINSVVKTNAAFDLLRSVAMDFLKNGQ